MPTSQEKKKKEFRRRQAVKLKQVLFEGTEEGEGEHKNETEKDA